MKNLFAFCALLIFAFPSGAMAQRSCEPVTHAKDKSNQSVATQSDPKESPEITYGKLAVDGANTASDVRDYTLSVQDAKAVTEQSAKYGVVARQSTLQEIEAATARAKYIATGAKSSALWGMRPHITNPERIPI